MKINKLTLGAYPEALRHIPSPPAQLFHAGTPLSELMKRPRVAIVGSRSVSPYGKQVTTQLARQLAEQGIVIISGLALGVDGLAHQATLEAGGLAIAVLPSPLQVIAPATNRQLGQAIIERGGALVSEYAEGAFPQKQNFIARNRLVAGLSQAILITEAAEKSGSLHTARFALEQGKDVLAVPGNITGPGSVGANNLIKAGATPVTSYVDVLHALGLEEHQTAATEVRGRNAYEQRVLDLLLQGVGDGDQLFHQSQLSTSEFNQVLTMLEIGGKIRSLGANHWAIY
ncbi:MAG TPA: DNA-processing protein DprA [Verrucomicrobiae bacterium]|jgi:DNA processing protein|nr:DNA-processing protein DprA [Verrucomicrobiae bacterium]